jgi:2-keto-4-pentenoate hydratase/2-oxohepta-3-ene-1,7-dioic acid hydratase in catechol pathway
MRLVTFRHGGDGARAGVLAGNKVTGLGTSMLQVIFSGSAPAPSGESYDLSAVTLLAPIPRPPKFICVGLNYRDHAIESNMAIPKVPTIFNKFPSVVHPARL